MSSMLPRIDGEGTQNADSNQRTTEEKNGIQQTCSTQEMDESAFTKQRFSSQTLTDRATLGEIQTIPYQIRRVTNWRVTAEEIARNHREGQSYQDQIKFAQDWLKLLFYLYKETGLSRDIISDLKYNPRYKIHKIRQGKYGKLRTIEEPTKDLKVIQKALIPLFELYPLSPSCTSQKGCSAVVNAERHKYTKYMLKVDIKKCYPNTTNGMILRAIDLMKLPDSSTMTAALQLCMLPYKAELILPTGAPTSPILCNIALTPIDLLVENMLSTDYPGKYTYSRYLDDLIISTTHETRNWEIKHKVEEIIIQGGWAINTKKTRWFTSNESDKPTVTGVRVGDFYGIPREFHREVRARLQNLALKRLDIDAETRGCLSYIKSVDKKRYNKLLAYYQRRVDHEGSCTERSTSQ